MNEKDMQRMIKAGQEAAMSSKDHPLNNLPEDFEPINITQAERAELMHDLRNAARQYQGAADETNKMTPEQYERAKQKTLEEQRALVKELKFRNAKKNQAADNIRSSKAANAYLSEFEKRHGTNLTPGEIAIFRDMDKHNITITKDLQKANQQDDTDYEFEDKPLLPKPDVQMKPSNDDDVEYEY